MGATHTHRVAQHWHTWELSLAKYQVNKASQRVKIVPTVDLDAQKSYASMVPKAQPKTIDTGSVGTKSELHQAEFLVHNGIPMCTAHGNQQLPDCWACQGGSWSIAIFDMLE